MIPAEMARNVLSTELTPQANAVLKRTCSETKLAKKDVVALIVAWFAEQEPEVQDVVLGRTPPSLVDAAKEIALSRLKASPERTRLIAEIKTKSERQ